MRRVRPVSPKLTRGDTEWDQHFAAIVGDGAAGAARAGPDAGFSLDGFESVVGGDAAEATADGSAVSGRAAAGGESPAPGAPAGRSHAGVPPRRLPIRVPATAGGIALAAVVVVGAVGVAAALMALPSDRDVARRSPATADARQAAPERRESAHVPALSRPPVEKETISARSPEFATVVPPQPSHAPLSSVTPSPIGRPTAPTEVKPAAVLASRADAPKAAPPAARPPEAGTPPATVVARASSPAPARSPSAAAVEPPAAGVPARVGASPSVPPPITARPAEVHAVVEAHVVEAHAVEVVPPTPVQVAVTAAEPVADRQPRPARPQPSPRVAGVQRALLEDGIDPGPVDGVFGPQTREAVRSYQSRAGLEPTGIIDAALLHHLTVVDPMPVQSAAALADPIVVAPHKLAPAPSDVKPPAERPVSRGRDRDPEGYGLPEAVRSRLGLPAGRAVLASQNDPGGSGGEAGSDDGGADAGVGGPSDGGTSGGGSAGGSAGGDATGGGGGPAGGGPSGSGSSGGGAGAGSDAGGSGSGGSGSGGSGGSGSGGSGSSGSGDSGSSGSGSGSAGAVGGAVSGVGEAVGAAAADVGEAVGAAAAGVGEAVGGIGGAVGGAGGGGNGSGGRR